MGVICTKVPLWQAHSHLREKAVTHLGAPSPARQVGFSITEHAELGLGVPKGVTPVGARRLNSLRLIPSKVVRLSMNFLLLIFN